MLVTYRDAIFTDEVEEIEEFMREDTEGRMGGGVV